MKIRTKNLLQDWGPWVMLAFAVGLVLWYLGKPKLPKEPADYAAWWQAVFSVAAIVSAVLISAIQQSKERRRERREQVAQRFERFNKLASLLMHALTIVENFPAPECSPEENFSRAMHADLSGLDRVIATLERFGPADVDDGTKLVVLLKVIELLRLMRGYVGLSYQNLQATSGKWNPTLNPMTEALKKLRLAWAGWSQVSQAYGAEYELAS